MEDRKKKMQEETKIGRENDQKRDGSQRQVQNPYYFS